MSHILASWSLVLLLAAQASAQSLRSSNATTRFIPASDSNDQLGVVVHTTDGMPGPPSPITLIPQLQNWNQSFPANGLYGTVEPTTTNNVLKANSSQLAWISCDTADYPGNLGAEYVLQNAVSANVSAVILYSQEAPYCNYTTGPSISTSYVRIYSMTSARDSSFLQNILHYANQGDYPQARINVLYKLAQDNGTDTPSGNNMQQQQPGGPSPSTAVAMIILYSITGVITALFLLIIITGAIRAHRHPERYGPRAVLGRARQSRAKGLARAMLDSIPIVKFGDNEGDIPKSDDVELTASAAKEGTPETIETVRSKEGSGEAKEEDTVAGAARPRPSHESEDGIRANTAEAAAATEQPSQAQGCSICTEDFERGEDVRVLPCNHKFHPPCIDPWLLNVSGTCPLCRIDLRPPTSEDAEHSGGSERANPTGPPDVIARLGVSADDAASNRRHSNRLSFIFDPLNRRRMQEASPEERIQALRQYNERQRTHEDSRRRRMSNRLSVLIGRSSRPEVSTEDASHAESTTAGASEAQPAGLDEPPRRLDDEHEDLDAAQPPSTPVLGASEAGPATSSPSRHMLNSETEAQPSSTAGAEASTSTSGASIYEEAPEQGNGSNTRPS